MASLKTFNDPGGGGLYSRTAQAVLDNLGQCQTEFSLVVVVKQLLSLVFT